ncbi:NADH:ubiquinone oxidoreductase subunit NDUFA12 [Kordiimonas sp. SCSIO 12603]|uniref:NADH:ubiquinone oxidoreductase subunit NDUFA12 n=1 Tax=Kordiimonas sp. SCSIO 12603 TaxID=2829596 RepID=UPI00210686B0|nr:NADH:ubiquinone oxidoreductase subunit NDUFA12 [Kordiimonas sp. SCSIO 12603]UTW57306.1 NADH:ubiquinone oxidoreductase subunit NDUFA12 [Kordiimonas sp. SCSIO 12603]
MSSLFEGIFKSPIFTWWNSATFGTRLFTSRKGELVGTDDQGNEYYREKGGKRRWVIYKNGPVEASRVPAEWHGWLHYTVDELPHEQKIVTREWEKEHMPNLTGTAAAHVPQARPDEPEYEAWRP